jgi:hypothetical protein
MVLNVVWITYAVMVVAYVVGEGYMRPRLSTRLKRLLKRLATPKGYTQEEWHEVWEREHKPKWERYQRMKEFQFRNSVSRVPWFMKSNLVIVLLLAILLYMAR